MKEVTQAAGVVLWMSRHDCCSFGISCFVFELLGLSVITILTPVILFAFWWHHLLFAVLICFFFNFVTSETWNDHRHIDDSYLVYVGFLYVTRRYTALQATLRV
jgi:hypothetical protein